MDVEKCTDVVMDEVDRPGFVDGNDRKDSSAAHLSNTVNKPTKAPSQKMAQVDDSEAFSTSQDSSLTLFHEKYDTIDVTDYPHPDPGYKPDSENGERKLFDLDATDFPLMNKNKGKIKSVLRHCKKIDGIPTKHTTYFPPKRGENYDEYNPGNVFVNSSRHYTMNTFPRGVVVVFNMEHFMRETGMADFPRKGTERDADGLCALFLELGFIVERVDNPTVKMVDVAMEKIASEGQSISCAACVVLTHGEEDRLYAIDGPLDIKQLTRKFRKKALAGKPKLFFFQACRGSDYMDSLDAMDGPPVVREPDDVALPCEADFFYAYSTVPGYYSWRNSRNGSWFMQALCSVFRINAHNMDLVRMLTHVNDQVSSRKSRTDDVTTDDKRQIASLVSQLRKELFFFPPYGPLLAPNPTAVNPMVPQGLVTKVSKSHV